MNIERPLPSRPITSNFAMCFAAAQGNGATGYDAFLMETRLTMQLEDSGAPVRCQLVVVEGPEFGRAIALDAPRTVGTASACSRRPAAP